MDLEHEQHPADEGQPSAVAESGGPSSDFRHRQPRLKAGVVVALAAVGFGIWYANRPAPKVDIFGTLTLSVLNSADVGTSGALTAGDPCVADGGYSDIAAGTAVTVGGASGQTLAVGALHGGVESNIGSDTADCVFSFDVRVDAGQSLYTVTISHRGTQTISADRLADGIALTLGN